MKLKQFIFALVAMLSSFAFTANAQNVAKVGNIEYATIDDAIAAWTNNTTLTLLADVTLSDVVTLNSTEHHILNLGTYTMTAASGKNAIVIKACGTGDSERTAITINADATNPGGINAGSKCVVYYKYADGGISTNDRPIIKINGGVFTGSTSTFLTYGIYTIGTEARKCATLDISGGTFNCSIYGSGKSKLIISGGVFNYSVGSQGDSTALRLISGGTFNTFGFMTADEKNTKFWFGTSMGNSNVGVHVDDNGYIVVGGPVVTEAGDNFEASSTNYSGANRLLQYSSAKDNGLYYTSVEEALADNNTASGEVTVYADEVDMSGINFKGTIIVPEGESVTINNAPADLKVATTDGNIIVNNGGVYESKAAVAKIGDNSYATLAEALTAAANNATVELLWKEGDAPIAMNGAVFGKNVTITGTATVDWNKGFLFIGRGGAGDATVTFDNANLTSASNSASYGIHVSGREKNTDNKYDGTVVIKNSTIVLDYLINKGTMTLDNAILTVKNGFAVGGRPASETESGEDATATMTLNNNSKLVVNNHNGMGLGYEAIGVMNVNTGSTFEATGDFLATAKGTMNVNAGTVKVAGKFTNNGTVNYTDATVELAKLDNDNLMFLNNNMTIKVEDATGSSYAIRANDGVVFNNSYVKGTANETVRLLGDATFNGGFQCSYLQGSSAGIGGEVIIEDGTTVKATYGIEFSKDYVLSGGTLELSDGNANGKLWGCVFQSGTYIINTNVNVNSNGSTAPIHFTKATATINSSITQKNSGGEPMYIADSSVVTLGNTAVIDALSVHGAGKLIIDAKDGEYANVKCGASGFTGTLEVINNDKLEASIVDGKIVLAAKPAAKIGEQGYATLEAAYEAAVNGDVIVLNESVTTFPVINKAVTFKGGKENAAVEINYALSQNFTAIDGIVRFENLTFNKPLFTEHGGNKPDLSIEFEGCNFNVNSEAGYGILIGTSWSNSVVKGLKVNNCNFKYVGTEFKGGYMLYVQCVNEVTITNNTIDGNNLYRGAIHLGDATEHATVATVSNNTIKNFCRGVMMGNRVVGSSATISGNTFDNINYSDKDSKPAQECAPIFIHSIATAEALQIALTNNKVENCANPMIYSEDTDLIKYYVTEFTGNTVAGAAVELANSYNAPNQIFPVATINDAEYFTLQDAINAVQNGETITLVDNVTISAATAGYTDGTYTDGVRYTGDKSFTVDFNGKTVTDDGCVNDYLIYINNKGEKASEITFTNGTIVSANGCWSAVCVNSSAATQNVELNLNGMNITNSNDAVYSGNPVVRARDLATVNVNDGTIITSNGASYGVAANTDGSTVNINEGATIVQQNSGTTSGNSVFAAVGGKGVINIKGGTITSDRYGVHTMTTGTPVINISGGTITAPVALRSSTNGGNGELATINVTGGTINGTLETYTDNSKIVVSGGTFSEAVAEEYCADGFVPAENADGTFGVEKASVASINGTKYTSLAEAVAAAQAGDEIVLIADVKTTDGVVITDKNLTIDLNGKTYTVTEGANTNNRNFKINGTSVVTVKNGTMVAAGEYSSGAYGTIRTEGTANVTLTGLKLYNYRGNGLNVKACTGTTVTIENTEIYANYGGGIESAGGTIVVNDGVTVKQEGMYTAPYNSMAISVNGGGKVTVNGGTFSTECITAEEANNQGTSHGPWVAGVLNSGGTLIINGGTFSNDNFGENSLATAARGAILADTKAKVEINGGTFNVLKNVIDIQNNLGDANNNPSVLLVGGTYSADPRVSAQYGSNLITLAENCIAVENNGVWNVELAAAKIGETKYETLEAAFAAATEGQTITMLAGTHSEGTIKLPATLKNVTIKGAASVARSTEETILKDMTISAADGNSYSYIGLTFDGITFDNSRILLTGWRNGEETIENLTVTNCTFKNLNDNTNSAPVHINKDAAEAVKNFTFTNNVIDGATGGSKSGIYAQVTGNVVVENNVINNVSFRPYIIQVTTDDGIADNFTVTGNTFSGSAVGRAQGLGNNAEGADAVTLVVSNNIFKGITDAQQICYWNFNAATTTADLSKNYYDIDILANPGKIYYNSAAADNYALREMNVFPIYTALNENGTIKTESAFTPKFYIAKVGENSYETLAEALAAAQPGNEVVILKAGTYNVPTGKNLTITATVEGVEFANIGAHNMGGASMTFNNVTFTYATNSEYKGLQHSGNLVYNNCTFNGQVFLYGESETFNKCTFNTTDSNNYNVWTYGAKEVAFNECTFNSAGKSVLVYTEGANTYNNVSVTKCQFNASQAVDGKAAIEMDSSLSAGINLTIDGETTATGFANGNVSGNSLWNNKKGNNDIANNDITVVVGDETALAPAPIVVYYQDGTNEVFYDMLKAVPYTTNYPKLEGATIKLLADVAASGLRFMENDMVFDLNDHTYTITAGTGSQGTNTSGFQIRPEVTTDVTFKNGTIKVAEGAPVVYMFNNYATNFILEDVTVDCTNMAWSYGNSCYVVVSRGNATTTGARNVEFKGNTTIENFNSSVAGTAYSIDGTMTVGENVECGGSFKLAAGATLTAKEGLNVETEDGYILAYNNGVYATISTTANVATYAELKAAIANADIKTIVLTADINCGTEQLAITKEITLDLGGKTLTTGNAYGGMSIKGNPTIKNGTIVHASNTAAIKVWNATAFEDLVIDVQGKGDANKTIGGIVLQSGSTTKVGSIKNVTIKGAALTNGIETYNCGDATENVIGSMENVTIDAQSTGLLISAPCGTATNCDIKGGVNGVEIFIKGNYSASLDLVNSKVDGGVYAHDEFSSNPSIVNNGTLKFTADAATTGASAEDVTLEIARAEAEKVQGVLNDVMENAKAKVNNVYYATLDAAIKAAKAGDVVTVFEGTYAVPAMKAGITIVGEGNVLLEGTLSGTLENLTMKNIHIKGGDAQRWAYAKGNLLFENVTFEATSVYALHFDGITKGATLTYKDCTIIGWAALGGSPASCVFDGCTIKDNGAYGVIRTYFDTTIENCTFDVANANTTDVYQDGIHAVDGANVVVDNCTNANGDMKDIVNVGDTSIVVLNGVEIKNAAQAGSKYYATFAEALDAVNAGETLTLLEDINLSEILVLDKAITLDGNGKKLTSTAGRAINVSGADGVTIKNLTINASGERAINVIQNATNVTIDNVTATADNYTVNVAASAPNAVVAIKNSTLNGLCTVNVAAAEANVTVDNSTVNCNDNNTTAGEAYAALCLNKDAVGGSIVATNSTINVTDGSDSKKAKNGADGGVITIDGSTDGVAVMVAAITYEGNNYYYSFETLEDAIEFAKAGNTITLLRNVTMDYNARDAYETQAQNVVIDGNGKVLTLNQKNSDWASFGLANDSKLVLKNMTIEKTGYGDTNGAWNTHAIIFSCPVEMTDVTVNNSVAVQAGATLNNVTINEANGYYGLWINGNGQAVTVNGGAINATNGGRGIKIADEYIASPAQVTLNVDGTVFNTAKKAAVLVSSTAGAQIAAANVNIANVAEDNVNFVWVDEDWAQHFGNVEVTGATVRAEGVAAFTAAITANGTVQAYYKTLAEAINAAEAGATVTLLADIEANEVILIDKSLTINGNDHKVTSSATRVFRVTTANTEVTLNDVNMVSTAVRVGENDVRGISIDIVENVELTLNNSSVDFTDASANDWAYAVNVTGGNNHVVIVNGGEYEGANVINVRGANNNVTVKDAVITSTYPNNDQFYGACIWVLQNQGSSVEATGNTFNGSNTIAFNIGAGTALTESNNTNNTTMCVAKIGAEYYTSLADAFAVGGEVTVLHDIVLAETAIVPAGKVVTLNLNGKTISQEKECTASYEMICNKGDLTITGNGKLSFTDTSAGDPTFGWGSYTVRNEGNLVVENGTIEHLGAQTFAKHCIMAIYQYCGSTTINGGTISTPNYRSARLWKGDMTINGGTFDGQVWVQAVDNTAKLTVNGGTFAPNGNDASAVFVTNSDYDVQFAVTDGTFNGKVGCSDATKLAGAITGGKFTETAKNGTNAALLATGLAFGEANADGYYTIADDPATHYIATLDELKAFRDAVNSGTNYYAGVTVYLAADIDMAGENWVGIGSATKDHGFMGNFDGQNFKIKNLTIDNPALDSEGYAYAGLFAVTEGTDKDNQNSIKNLTIENVTINTTGHIVSAAIAYPYYTIVDNVKVCGDIKINGGDYTAGVLAYTRRCVNASNLSVVGNTGSYVKGNTTVGGVISDIQMNGGLTAVYNNFSAEGIAVEGTKSVGAISGIISGQNLDKATVKNVELNSQDGLAGIVAGRLGVASTVTNVSYENVTGAATLIGGGYDSAKAVQAQIGDTYYATLAEAINAAEAGATVELLADVTLAGGYTDATEGLRIEKEITLNGNNHTIDCGTFQKGIRVYNPTKESDFNVNFNNVTVVNNVANGRCIDTRSGNINLKVNSSTLIATNGNSQPLTIGGNDPVHRVTLNGTTIDAGNSGYAVISFVSTNVDINGANNSTISGFAAFYLKGDAQTTNLNLGQGVYTGINNHAVESGVFGTVVLEGNNNVVNLMGTNATVKAVANNTAPQAAFLVRGANNTIKVTKESAKIITEGNAYEAIVDADNAATTKFIDMGVERKLVAEAGGRQFYSFEEAVRFAGNEGTIKIVNDFELAEAWTIPAGKKYTLDLNGKTVTYTSAVAGEDMITNRGNLTITDSSDAKTGKLAYVNTDTTASNVTVSTISTEAGSTLVVDGGTIENKTVKADGSSIYSFAIDILTNGNLGDVNVTINGGTVYSDYMAIRQFNNGTACKNSLTINDGYIYGAKRAVQVHMDNNAAVTAIKGGKVEAGEDGYAICNFAATGNLEVTGGEFIGSVYSARENFISGGIYDAEVYAGYCAEGYMPNKNANGTYGVVAVADAYASIDGVTYGSLKAAIDAAKAGETITLLQNVKENVTISKAVTLDGAGKTITGMITTDGKSLNVAIKNVNFDGNNGTINYAMRADDNLNLLVENCTASNYLYGFLYANKSNDKIVVKNVTVENCALYGAYLVSFNNATFENFTVKGNTDYGIAVDNAGARTVNLKNVTFEDAELPLHIEVKGTNTSKITFKFSGINDMSKAEYYTSEYVNVVAAAQIGTKVCGSLQDAVVAANDGDTVKVLADVNMTTANFVTQVDGYATLVNVAGKAVTIDLNGKKVKVNAANADLDGKAKGNMLMSVFHADPNGTLTLTDSSAEGTGTVELIANDATVYGLIVSENANDKSNPGRIIIDGGNYIADKLSDSMIFADINEVITVNGGNFSLGNVGTGTNGKPWIFNTTGQNLIHINVNGGTYNANIGKQYYRYEVKLGEGLATTNNGDGTWTVVPGVATVGEELFGSIQEAIKAAQDGETVKLIADVALDTKKYTTQVDNLVVLFNVKGKAVTFDLNGKKIDVNASAANLGGKMLAGVFSADVEGDFTITDSSAEGTGAVNVAVNDANVYSVFISENAGDKTKSGKMTVNAGNFTTVGKVANAMIYADTDKVVTINGGTFICDGVSASENYPWLINTHDNNVKQVTVNGGTFNVDINHQYRPFEVFVPENLAVKANGNGTWTIVPAQAYVTELLGAYVNEAGSREHNVGYATVAEAIAATNDLGKTVTILADDYTGNLNVNKGIAVQGEVDENGNNLVTFNGKLNITADGATVKNINVNNGGNSAGYINAKNVVVDSCQVVGGNGFRTCYTTGTVTFKNSVITGATYGIHFDGSANGNIVIENCTITGWTSFASTITNVAISGTTFADGNYDQLRFYQNAQLTDCVFNENMSVDFGDNDNVVAFENCTVENGGNLLDVIYIADIAEGNEVTIDGEPIIVAAKIDSKYYLSLQAAIDAATEGQTVTIVSDIALTEGVTVAADDNIFINLNGFDIIGTPAEAKAFAVITNRGTLTIEGEGSVICNHTLAGSTGYAVNTITNSGTLTINGNATIENKSTAQYQIGYAIDNNSTTANATVTVNGGKVIASGSLYYDGIRLFCNSATLKNDVYVAGGEVSTIWMQNPSDGATDKNTKDINGYVGISGGTVGVLSLEPSANFDAAVTGGHVGEVSYFQTAEGRDLKEFVTGGTFGTQISENFLAWGYQLDGDAAPYMVKWTGRREVVTIEDGKLTEFANEKKITVGTLTYKRKFSNASNQALYVPFEVPMSEISDDFNVYYISNMHAYDKDEDAVADSLVLEAFKVPANAVLKANYPYIIRAKVANTEMNIELSEATLHEAEENSIECSSVFMKFEITGNYHKMEGEEILGKYALKSGTWQKALEGAYLNPFRMYMTITESSDSPYTIPSTALQSIGIRIAGEQLEDGTTVIYHVEAENNSEDVIFDLSGRRVLKAEKGGIYIINGKKVLVK